MICSDPALIQIIRQFSVFQTNILPDRDVIYFLKNTIILCWITRDETLFEQEMIQFPGQGYVYKDIKTEMELEIGLEMGLE